MRVLVLSLILAALAGCATLPEGGALPQGGFELSGRVAVRWRGEAASGRVDWRHSDQSDEMLVTSPLGQGIARVSRTSADGRTETVLETSDGKRHVASDPEELTGRVLGWRLPLEGLPHWVRGRALPGRSAQIQRDPQGQPSLIEQDGWRIDCSGYEDGRPTRLTLTRDDMEIRLAVDRWSEAVSRPAPSQP